MGSATASESRDFSVHKHEHDGLAVRAQGLCFRGKRPRIGVQFFEKLLISESDGAALDAAANAPARQRFKRFRRAGERDAAILRALDDRRSQRMLAAALERCCKPQQFVCVKSVGGLDRNELAACLR